MKINLNETILMDALTMKYETPNALSKKTRMNWFIAFGTLCVMALEGKIDYLRLENQNYLFKVSDEGVKYD